MQASETEQAAARPPIRVLQSLRRQTENDNPYLRQMIQALGPHAEVEFFSWHKALFGAYDVFHVHWPEFLLREHRRGKVLQYALFLAFILRLTVLGRPVVRTLHNLEPHEGARPIERTLLRLLDRRTRVWIRLNATTELRKPETVTILHGHYRDWFAGRSVPAVVPGRLLYFGLIRPYKGVESLLEAFQGLDPARAAELGLRVVGHPTTPEIRAVVEAAIRTDPRIDAVLEYVDESALAHEIGEAELIVLPFRQMHNSGSALLALSLNRPVLVPRNRANEALAEEMGPGWVCMYDGELSSEALSAAVLQVRSGQRTPAPDFSRRNWVEAGEHHYRAYVAAVRRAPVGA